MTAGVVAALVSCLFHLACGIGLSLHIRKHLIHTFLFGHVFWMIAGFAGGILSVLAFWLIHHSSLAPNLRNRREPAGIDKPFTRQ
jgi:H+/Cl- antiporter ClcA